MPPKQKITKQMVLEAGYDIAKRNGMENVNSRNIAKVLSCSTQPIFSCFSTMEDLKKNVFDFVFKKFIAGGIEYVNSKKSLDFLGLSIQWYLELLRNEPHLYNLIFCSKGFGIQTPDDFISRYTSNEKILSKMQTYYELSLDECKDILLRSYALMHGIGTLIFFNDFKISNEEIVDIVKRTVAEMVLSSQNKKEAGS
ncbi:hypothetical protein SDC9_98450 [bioreactor metagenome]|uniref:HTH tetR-type domain-containing protein n=1 Tax=bioreactor metagenome TaxID=1076179 RepID=A0A645AEU7_9ZZZZ